METGRYAEFQEEIIQSVEFIRGLDQYEAVLGYGFSTGGGILADFLLQRGDALFDAFVFASPFFDWDFPDSVTNELLLEVVPNFALCLGVLRSSDPVQPGWQPERPSKTAVFLNLLYELDADARPFYDTPATVGFAQSANALNKALRSRAKPATSKPTLVLTSTGDTSASSVEVLSLIGKVASPQATTIALFTKQQHDVFIGLDEEDNDESIKALIEWIKTLD
jgi:alpha-beta hydrolase superfamily lysophospholipase